MLNPLSLLLDKLEKLIVEHGSASIMREHIALIRDKLQFVAEESIRLKDENSRLFKENEELNHELLRHVTPENFVEKLGVLFKKKGGLGYSEIPYCPVCKTPLSSRNRYDAMWCSHCGFETAHSLIVLSGVSKKQLPPP